MARQKALAEQASHTDNAATLAAAPTALLLNKAGGERPNWRRLQMRRIRREQEVKSEPTLVWLFIDGES